MTRLKKMILLGIALLAAAGALYCFLAPRPVLVLGFVGGLTGRVADLGIDCRRGAELAIAAVNRNGGVNGRQVRLLAVDDGQNEGQARQAVQELIDRKLPVIIGHTTSAMSLATLPLIDAGSTLMVSPTTSTPLLSGRDDNFIRACAVSTEASMAMARYLRRVKGIRRAGVVYDTGNRGYTGPWFDNFARTFREEGGEAVEGFTFTSGPDTRLLPLVTEMRRKDLDALVIVANSVDGAMFCQQVRKIGWSIPLALADWAATEQLISLGGQAVENAVISQYFNRLSDQPGYLRFKKEFEQDYRAEPGFGALHAYNATMMVLESMARQKPGETLKQTILRISRFKGLQEDLVINRYGDSSNPTYIGVIRNGTFDIVGDYR